jgi:hypothetical protein
MNRHTVRMLDDEAKSGDNVFHSLYNRAQPSDRNCHSQATNYAPTCSPDRAAITQP